MTTAELTKAKAAAPAGPVDYATDPHLDKEVREFLKVVNAGPPVESLSKQDARNVLVGAQASVPVDLSGIEESEKTITNDGFTVKLNIVRPEGVKEDLPAFHEIAVPARGRRAEEVSRCLIMER